MMLWRCKSWKSKRVRNSLLLLRCVHKAHLPHQDICTTTTTPCCLRFARGLRMFAHLVPFDELF